MEKEIIVPSCQHCKNKEGLKVNSKAKLVDGTIRTYYLCNICINKSRKEWYHNGGKKFVLKNNKTYMDKKKAAKK